MGWTLLTVAAAAGGGLLLMRLRVPGGMLVGAILGAVLVNRLQDRRTSGLRPGWWPKC